MSNTTDRLVRLADPFNLCKETAVPCRDTDLLLEALGRIEQELGLIGRRAPRLLRIRLDAVRSLCVILSPVPLASRSQVFAALRRNVAQMTRSGSVRRRRISMRGATAARRTHAQTR